MRLQQQPWGFARRILGFAVLLTTLSITFTACSKGSSVAKGTTTTGDVADTGTDGTDGTTTTTTTDTTGTTGTTGTTSTDNTNLFDTDLTSSEQQGGTSTVQNPGYPSQQYQQCLQGGFNQYNDDYSNSSCISPDQSGLRVPLDQDYFANGTLGVYGMMQGCLETVLAHYPQSDADAAAFHQQGRMALARCYMQIVSRTRRAFPWGNQAMSSFNYNYQTINTLLVTFRVLQ